jgi:hypothetical protein
MRSSQVRRKRLGACHIPVEDPEGIRPESGGYSNAGDVLRAPGHVTNGDHGQTDTQARVETELARHVQKLTAACPQGLGTLRLGLQYAQRRHRGRAVAQVERSAHHVRAAGFAIAGQGGDAPGVAAVQDQSALWLRVVTR